MNSPAQQQSASDLPLIWKGWAQALRLMDSKRAQPQPEAQAQADAYEQCATELREALSSDRSGQNTERMWCTACGTVTRDGICDCNQWFDKGHEMYREPQLVNYADTMADEAHKLAQEVDRLTSLVEGVRDALLTLYKECAAHNDFRPDSKSMRDARNAYIRSAPVSSTEGN